MQHIWKTYKTPIALTGGGLFVALILGFAPLMNRAGNDTANGATLEQMSALIDAAIADAETGPTAGATAPVGSDEIAALRQQVAQQAAQISDLQNRNANVDRAITRTAERTRDTELALATLETATQRLSDLEAQMNTLNSAVPRISQRVREAQSALVTLDTVAQRLGNLEVQMDTINAAVPRMSSRISDLQNALN